ncbi:MAG TPA: hypothetical protein VK961_18215 [Chthoniobacter sp.]|nr:hypothetical protein [Chthoniobacter sp.]
MSEWRDLFAPPAVGVGSFTCSFRVLRRHGHDLLALPLPRRAAARALTLYAAQTRFARCSKALLSAALRAGLPVPLPRVDLPVAENDPLLTWLRETLGTTIPPALAILAGNPFAPGRRFILLAFRDDDPAIVAKVGTSSEARTLIQAEATFLESVAGRRPHLPGFRGMKVTDTFSALALEFVDGRSPAATDTAGLRTVLQSWLDTAHPVALDTLAPWQRLATQAEARPIMERVADRAVAPALSHGDFAPWNVRVECASQRWTVIDWERGIAAGVPAWDWFHWMLHVSVLVHRHDTAASAEFLRAALQSPDFQEYARAAQITGLEDALLVGYLIYFHEFVLPPSPSWPLLLNLKTTIAALRDLFLARL